MSSKKKIFLSGAAGLAAGCILTALLVYLLMPGMMIKKYRSRLEFDQTVSTIQTALKEQGWSTPGTMNMNKAMAKHGVQFEPRVSLVSLCNADYASKVLKTDRYVAALMPCKIAVWEDDSGEVWVSKVNTGLMGKLFGGTIARIMGGSVARDEQRILSSVIKE